MSEWAPALTFGPGFSDVQHRIDGSRLRQERAERMRAVLRRHQVPAVLASGPAAGRYLAGVSGAEFNPQLWYVLFFAGDEPVVFAHAGYVLHGPREAPWIQHWRVARSWLSGLPGAEASRAEAGKFAAEIVAELTAALREAGLAVVGGGALLMEAAAVKSAEEMRCISLSVAMAEAGWHPFMAALAAGGTEAEVVQAAATRIAALGGEPRVGIRSGPLTFERGIPVVLQETAIGRQNRNGDAVKKGKKDKEKHQQENPKAAKRGRLRQRRSLAGGGHCPPPGRS